MSTRTELLNMVERYLDCYPSESQSLIRLLDAMDTTEEIFDRSSFPLHVTCSAVVIDDTGSVLMIHHRALDKWLIPGGHVDATDTGLVAAALRELQEETSIGPDQAASLDGWNLLPLDIDIHDIPANEKKNEPTHLHADLRFVFKTMYPRINLQEEEVTQYAWRSPKELPTERLVEKTITLANESITW